MATYSLFKLGKKNCRCCFFSDRSLATRWHGSLEHWTLDFANIGRQTCRVRSAALCCHSAKPSSKDVCTAGFSDKPCRCCKAKCAWGMPLAARFNLGRQILSIFIQLQQWMISIMKRSLIFYSFLHIFTKIPWFASTSTSRSFSVCNLNRTCKWYAAAFIGNT